MKIIDELVEAYNRGDAHAFANVFAEDAQAFEHPGRPAQQTREGIYQYYAKAFENFPALKTEVLYRAVIGNRVIDHERVQRSPETEPFDAIAVYEIENGLIVRLDIIRDPNTVYRAG